MRKRIPLLMFFCLVFTMSIPANAEEGNEVCRISLKACTEEVVELEFAFQSVSPRAMLVLASYREDGKMLDSVLKIADSNTALTIPYSAHIGYVKGFVLNTETIVPLQTAWQSDEMIPAEHPSETTLTLRINGTPVPVIWEENASTDALRELVRETPLTVSLSPYGGFEQVGSLGTSLPRSDARTTTQTGDIVLYSGSNIVLFYGSNTWAYTRLGRLDLPAREVQDLLGGSGVTVTLTVE